MQKVLKTFWHGVEFIASLNLVIMIILLFINVILRYGFDSGVLASAEIARFLFVWTTMFGAIICMRDEAHLDLRVIERFLTPKTIWVLRRVNYAIIVVASIMLMVGSIKQVDSNWSNISPMSGIPVAFMYMAGAFAGFSIAVIAISRIYKSGFDIQKGDS